MGIISATKRIAVELLKSMDDTTKHNLIIPLNALNEQVVNTVNGNLNFKDNMTSKTGSMTLKDGIMTIISNPLGNLKPLGIVAIDCSDVNGVKNIYITQQSAQNQIGITALFNTSSITASVSYLVIGG